MLKQTGTRITCRLVPFPDVDFLQEPHSSHCMMAVIHTSGLHLRASHQSVTSERHIRASHQSFTRLAYFATSPRYTHSSADSGSQKPWTACSTSVDRHILWIGRCFWRFPRPCAHDIPRNGPRRSSFRLCSCTW